MKHSVQPGAALRFGPVFFAVLFPIDHVPFLHPPPLHQGLAESFSPGVHSSDDTAPVKIRLFVSYAGYIFLLAFLLPFFLQRAFAFFLVFAFTFIFFALVSHLTALPSLASLKTIGYFQVAENRPDPKVSSYLRHPFNNSSLLLIHGRVCPVNRRLNILYIISKPSALVGHFTGQWFNGTDSIWCQIV